MLNTPRVKAIAIAGIVLLLALLVLALWPSRVAETGGAALAVAESESRAARDRRTSDRESFDAIAAPHTGAVDTEEDRQRREAARLELDAIAEPYRGPVSDARAEDEARIVAAAKGMSTDEMLDAWRARR